MEKGEFQKVDKSEQKMYGPWKLLVCGYSVEEQEPFLSFLEALNFKDLPVVFVTEEDLQISLEALLKRGDKEGFGAASTMTRTAILSGFTHNDLHRLISGYRQYQLPEQLWATVTPVSEKWPIAVLLEELSKEAQAMKKLRKAKAEQRV
ncbi:MAG: hypothetical protein DRG82_12905 [Deltaproteobacteria bacterium]|nr:MAG: hypothetical protein DRG82_12905 [Deltaproteobacteria bacterium]